MPRIVVDICLVFHFRPLLKCSGPEATVCSEGKTFRIGSQTKFIFDWKYLFTVISERSESQVLKTKTMLPKCFFLLLLRRIEKAEGKKD